MPQLDIFAFFTEIFWLSFFFLAFRYFLAEFMLPSIKIIFLYRRFFIDVYVNFCTILYNFFFVADYSSYLVFSILSYLLKRWFNNFISVYYSFMEFIYNLYLLKNIDSKLFLFFNYYTAFFERFKGCIHNKFFIYIR